MDLRHLKGESFRGIVLHSCSQESVGISSMVSIDPRPRNRRRGLREVAPLREDSAG